MGDYNADTHPNIQQAQIIARDYNFFGDIFCLTDQWTINETTRVNNFADGTKTLQCKVKYDPTSLTP